MEINSVRAFFKWCTILNGGLLVLASLDLAFAADRVFALQTQWFPIDRDDFNLAIYELLGFFKIVVIAFNLIPYIALVIIGQKAAGDKSGQ